MASKTKTTELIRKRKETKRGQSRKRDNAKKGTTNYYLAFGQPAPDSPDWVKKKFKSAS